MKNKEGKMMALLLISLPILSIIGWYFSNDWEEEYLFLIGFVVSGMFCAFLPDLLED